MQSDSRRSFVKNSLAASIAASQPTILAGLVRADGGGGQTTNTNQPWGTTELWGSTDPFGTTFPDTTWPDTTVPWGTTMPETSFTDTTSDPFQTTVPETTIPETTVQQTTVHFDLIGGANAPTAGPIGMPPIPINFNADGYGESAHWLVGLHYKFKLKFSASSVDADTVPHGDPLWIEATTEYYRVSDGIGKETPPVKLEASVIDQTDGTIEAEHNPAAPLPPPSFTGLAREFPIDADNRYMLVPKVEFLNLALSMDHPARPKQAILTGLAVCTIFVQKYTKDPSTGLWVLDTAYNSATDPSNPGGSEVTPFQISIQSHAHLSIP